MKKKVFISILTIVISFSLLKVNTFADGLYTWLYGTYTVESTWKLDNTLIQVPIGSGFSMNYNDAKTYVTFNYTMGNYRDGHISFTYSTSADLSQCDIFVANASIDSWNSSSKTLNLAINGTDNFTVTFVSSNMLSGISQGITSSYGTGTLDAVNAPAYSLHSIDSKLSNTNNTLNNILTAINNLSGGSSGETINYTELLTEIKSYCTLLSTINSNIEAEKTLIQNIYDRLSTTNEYLAGIYNTLNNVGWHNTGIQLELTRAYNEFITTPGQYDSTYNITTPKTNSNLFVNYRLLRFRINAYFDNGIDNIRLYSLDYAGSPYTTNLSDKIIYKIESRWYTDIYVLLNGHNTQPAGQLYFAFLPNTSFYWYSSELSSVSYLDISEDDYITVLSYINRVKNDSDIIDSIKAVENAVRNMSLNVNNMTVNATGITYNTTEQNVTNSVTNYNTNINTVNNIENNFVTQFNGNNNFNIDNIPITDQIRSTSNFMNNIVTQLYDIDIIKYPVTLMILGIIIIAILG